MTNLKTAAELKAIAKERSLDKYGILILANIIIFVLQMAISSIVTISDSGSLVIFTINEIIILIVQILLGILVSGKAYLYMNLIYSQTVSTSDIFFGLKQHPNKAVMIQSLFVLADFLASLPASIILFILTPDSPFSLRIALFVAVAIGIVVNIYVSLTYSQAFYLLHDYPDRSAKELLAYSKSLMQGNRLKLFYLHISFIPLIIFGCLTFFIPLLWISVYRYATLTAFYQNLIAAGNTGKVENGLN
ncbi:MAG: DUF975 family protein [Butyrivibrio sp.]|uniref:Uncharacterized membrane protein n=1 Tax=Butyrivibrio hungatei TaxID=185008 RepID=A0A1G5E7B9_9FIRM|nr:DUF975 family protein [Butyrivibrio hungatei]MBQ2608909.1 DUF975 family protein [Butyrivibrio sp.]MBR4358475.1 DUF975 family protein [Butyrivibrio sp.]MBR4640339.1 DUF975 family protein [Butyrivibrio sp.]SCY22631.1 Uncharacterized membrane protein [Butyrivibrio hungatei]